MSYRRDRYHSVEGSIIEFICDKESPVFVMVERNKKCTEVLVMCCINDYVVLPYKGGDNDDNIREIIN